MPENRLALLIQSVFVSGICVSGDWESYDRSVANGDECGIGQLLYFQCRKTYLSVRRRRTRVLRHLERKSDAWARCMGFASQQSFCSGEIARLRNSCNEQECNSWISITCQYTKTNAMGVTGFLE